MRASAGSVPGVWRGAIVVGAVVMCATGVARAKPVTCSEGDTVYAKGAARMFVAYRGNAYLYACWRRYATRPALT